MARSLIELRNVAKSFGNRQVLADVSLSIGEGEFVSIVGASASGKTTLLKIACGLLEATSGEVTFSGEPVRGVPRETAVVFQNYSLLPWLSALENVRLAVQAAWPEWPKERQREQAREHLRRVGLSAAMSKRPGQLSGGMRQRVAIARAFAVDPRVVFLDEPFGALDALTRATLQQELANLCQSAGRAVTVFMITNSVDEAMLLSNREATLARSRTAAGPATLNSPVPVPLVRPRTAHNLSHDEEAVRVRARIGESLSGAAPKRVPVEA